MAYKSSSLQLTRVLTRDKICVLCNQNFSGCNYITFSFVVLSWVMVLLKALQPEGDK